MDNFGLKALSLITTANFVFVPYSKQVPEVCVLFLCVCSWDIFILVLVDVGHKGWGSYVPSSEGFSIAYNEMFLYLVPTGTCVFFIVISSV